MTTGSHHLGKNWPTKWHWGGDCCIWHGATVGKGASARPVVMFMGKHARVARLVCEEFHGPLKEGEFALHKPPCNNGMCVAPDHLYPGNQSQNMMDQPQEVRFAKAQKAGLASVRRPND